MPGLASSQSLSVTSPCCDYAKKEKGIPAIPCHILVPHYLQDCKQNKKNNLFQSAVEVHIWPLKPVLGLSLAFSVHSFHSIRSLLV